VEGLSVDDKGNMIKLIAAVLVILAAVGFTFHRSRAAMPGAVANNGQMDEMEMPTSDEMHKNMKLAALAADLSTTQIEKLDQLVDEGIKEMEKMRAQFDENTTGPPPWRGGGGGGPGGGFPGMPGGGRGGMGGIGRVVMEGAQMMTPDQQQKFRQAMQSQGGRAKREAKTKAALGEADFERYQEKRRERFAGFGGRGGGRGGRGGNSQGQTQPSGTPPAR
jgi:hypothetical protein